MEDEDNYDEYLNENNDKKRETTNSSFAAKSVKVSCKDLIVLPKNMNIENCQSFKICGEDLSLSSRTFLLDTSTDKFYKGEQTILPKSSFINDELSTSTTVLVYTQICPEFIFLEPLIIETNPVDLKNVDGDWFKDMSGKESKRPIKDILNKYIDHPSVQSDNMEVDPLADTPEDIDGFDVVDYLLKSEAFGKCISNLCDITNKTHVSLSKQKLYDWLSTQFDKLCKIVAVDEEMANSDKVSMAVMIKAAQFLFGELPCPVLKYSFTVQILKYSGPNQLNQIFFPKPEKPKPEDYSKKGMEKREKSHQSKSYVKVNPKQKKKAEVEGRKTTGILQFFKKV